jgi:O-antigen/teichoic acid export membrane protein
MMPKIVAFLQQRTLQQAVMNWSVILTGLLLHNGLTAITLFIVARRIKPEAYGQYIAVYALLSFLVVLPGLGLDTWFLAQYLPTRERFTSFWNQSLRLRGSALLLWLGLIGLLGFILPKETYPWDIWLPTAISVAFDSFSLLSFAALRTQNKHKLVTVWQSSFAVSLFIVTFWLPVSPNYVIVFANIRMILSILLTLIIAVYYQRWYRDVKQTVTTLNQEILREGQAFMLTELASAVYVRADISIISLIMGRFATALYAPAINLLQASFLAPRAFFLFILPLLSKAFQKNIKFFNRQSILQLIVQAIIGAITSIVLFLFAGDILNLIFKEAYLGSTQYVRLLSPIPFLRALNFAVGTMLIASNRQVLQTKAQVIVAIFNIMANLIVIGPFGLVGISITYVISDAILLVITSFLLWYSSKNLT